ncbi:MAG: carboxypeptidase regulatory-like domain-containing protein [Planctomycetes bacterium]|nr:carboxypeptidase regulatory-like domain-containing protein [Planctomycetota bacterium]
MNPWSSSQRCGLRLLLAAAVCLAGVLPGALRAQRQRLNETFQISVAGQTAQVRADGSFSVFNVSAPDQFGAGGPGSRPDFRSDDFLRIVGVGFVQGERRWAFSEPFQVLQGQTTGVNGLFTITTVPPPLPVSLRLTLSRSILNGVAQQALASTMATLGNGSQVNVTPATAWTSYRTSNPEVVTVTENGVLTSDRPGRAFITATNGGATAVAEVVVTDATDPLTTVIGFVEMADGTRVAGAEVRIVGLPQRSTSGANGEYAFAGLPTRGVPEYNLRAVARVGTQTFLGSETGLIPVPGGFTDAGITVLGATGGFGPVILSGMDPEDHGPNPGGQGWQMIQDVIRFVVVNSAISAQPSRVLQLGGSVANASIALSAVTPLGFTHTHMTGAAITTVNFLDFDAIYMPTGAADVGGGLSVADLALINQRGPDIVQFINSGGGAAAFAQNIAGAFQWFPLGGLQVGTTTGSQIELTPEGQFILSPSATAVTPFHQTFRGPTGFFGLDVLAREANGQRHPLIIGGIVFLP